MLNKLLIVILFLEFANEGRVPVENIEELVRGRSIL